MKSLVAFLTALLPHLALTLVGAVLGLAYGGFIDAKVLEAGGLGHAAAHAGFLVAFLLAFTPLFMSFVGAGSFLVLSLILLIGKDALQRRWPRRATVRTAALVGFVSPWLDVIPATKHDALKIIHYVVMAGWSGVTMLGGFLAGLLLAQLLPHSSAKT